MSTVVLRSIVEQDISFPLPGTKTVIIKGRNKSGYLCADTRIEKDEWDFIKKYYGTLDCLRLAMITETKEEKPSSTQASELEQKGDELGVDKVKEVKKSTRK